MNAIREQCLFVILWEKAVSRSRRSLARHDEYS